MMMDDASLTGPANFLLPSGRREVTGREEEVGWPHETRMMDDALLI